MKRIMVGIITLLIAFFFSSSPTHAQIITTDKLITVDTGAQILRAWEGGKVIFETPVSTGLPKSRTIKGNFKIYLKYPVQARMRGVSPYIGRYDLKNVPHVMYFYRGYGIHGAYWHNSFGRPMSNGCVNLPLAAAEWLFNFAQIGTQVMVY